ncbi:vWA domain-containing protein [Jiangella endophytica]|uniref:vWA domain-containing protein n=1 Tax=Jiangella endophytica TaxID=1623398 RepID=UPI000E34ED6F|nr:VWA domain-containing protein [Jiangella endophytica]
MTLLRGADRAAFATAFGIRLREHGVAAGQTAVEDFVRALAACPPDSRSRLYWTARTTLVRRHGELAAFDAVFRAVFEHAALDLGERGQDGGLPPARGDEQRPADGATRGRADGGGLPWVTPPRVTAPAEEPGPVAVPQRLPSGLAGLPDAPFDQLDARQLALLGQWLRAVLPDWPTRRGRRLVADHAGHRVVVRPTIARARRTGWEAVTLVRARPARRPRRIVLLCDVSGSMRAQATAYLHLMRVVAAGAPGAGAETFAFATTLTRLTTVLAQRSPEEAVARATEQVTDRFGGTRIAASLRALLASHHADSTRGAVVVIASDGWDSDPPAELAAVLARLRRRAHRVVWLNPRAGAPDYAPAVASMAAALPYCDDFLPAGTFRSLADAIAVIGRHR